MNRKVIAEIIVALHFTSMLSLVFNVGVVWADAPIYITSDGSVDPPTEAIQRAGDVYTFTRNIYDSIIVERDNIIIDGRGYTVQGPRTDWDVVGYGFYLYERSNVTVKNCKVTGFETGIFLFRSSGNRFLGNTISNNYKGTLLLYSGNNVFRDNSIFDSSFNFGVLGSALPEFVQDVDTSNTVNGKSIYCWVNQHDSQIPADAGYVAVINSTNITVKNLNLSNNLQGVLFAYTVNSTIQGNTASDNRDHGIALYSSNNNKVSGNTASNNWQSGIALYSSNNNKVSGNTASNNPRHGIALRSSSNYNVLYHNNIINNTIQAYDDGTNTWDNGAEGNYWSDYKGKDGNGDGIGDTLLPHLGVDYYPLVDPWSSIRVFEAYVWNNITYYVITRSNSTIASFNFNHTLKQISFNVTGPSGTIGVCNVTVPKRLLTGDGWVVEINETKITPDITIAENSTHTFLYFTYSFSTYMVKIRAIDRPIEPFLLWIIGGIIVAVGMGVATIVLWKRKP